MLHATHIMSAYCMYSRTKIFMTDSKQGRTMSLHHMDWMSSRWSWQRTQENTRSDKEDRCVSFIFFSKDKVKRMNV
jgi:hypothetical protein